LAQDTDQAHITEVVRRNTIAAAVAALLLCYYGYYGLAEPVVTDLFTRSHWLFYHTLRIGGVLMGVIAVWSITGMVQALAVDGVVACLIGVLFALAGGGMLIDSGGAVGMNTILIIIFGMMFVGAGRRSWQTFRHLSSGGRVVTEEFFTTDAPAASFAPSPPSSAAPPVPAQAPVESASEPTVEATPEPTAETAPIPASRPEAAPEPEVPPGGFLASMANKPPPTQ